MTTWSWWGRAGHFVGGRDCRFHLHTHVAGDRYCVSTIGEYFPSGASEMQRIGSGRDDFYETMVFALDGDGDVSDWNELDRNRYANHDAANAGHLAMCEKWEVES